MIDSKEIEWRLKKIERLYSDAMASSEVSSELPALYGKIAVIELGGWVEETRDMLAEKLVGSLFETSEGVSRGNLLGRVSGFEYKQNFCRDIFQKLLGLHGVSEIEARLEGAEHEVFKANLGTLWKQRNACAHRTVSGAMEQIQGPATTILQLGYISRGLQSLEAVIDTLCRTRCRYWHMK